MVTQSIIFGLIFGILWGMLFSSRYSHLSKNAHHPATIKSSTWFLASTGVIRYLLLAVLLAILLVKKQIILPWWLGSFLIGFWFTLTYKIKPIRGNGEDSDI